jgi:PAS domain S-box-containing protein
MGKISKDSKNRLKERAQQLFKQKKDIPLELYSRNMEELLENLQNYQVELEMQNEELKRVQADLVNSRDRFQSILDFAPVGYCLLHTDGTVLRCNKIFGRLLDLHQDQVTGRKLSEFVAPASRDDFYLHIKKVRQKNRKSIAILELKNGIRTIHVKVATDFVSLNQGQENLMLCSVNDISREVSYYQRLKDREEQFRSLVNSMDDIIFTIDRDLRHSSVHGRWMAMIGREAKDFLGKRATEIMEEEAGLFHEKHFLKALKGESEVYEWTSGKGDDLQYFQTRLSPIYDEDGNVTEIVGVGRDITQAKRNNFDLQERVKEQKCLYEISKTLQNYHFPIDDLLQRCVEIIPSGFKVPEDAVAAIIAGDMIFFSHDAFDFESGKCLQSQASVDDAAYARVFVKYQGADSNGRVGFLTSFLPEEQQLIDIVARNVVQVLKNRQSKETLDEKNKKLDQLNAEKDRMMSILAHDLRSPLSSVLSFIGLLDERYDSMTSEAIKGYLESLNKSTKSYYKLLENLLEWASLQRGGTEIEARTYQVAEIVREAIDSNLNKIEDKNITVNQLIDPEVSLKADKTSMLSVFNNLLSNAVKFSERGGTITIKAVLSEDMVVCSVCDQGIGISKEMQQKLFNIDADIKRMGTENELSTGLGLLICKELVVMNGGKIWVESIEDEGSCFFFSVPLLEKIHGN